MSENKFRHFSNAPCENNLVIQYSWHSIIKYNIEDDVVVSSKHVIKFRSAAHPRTMHSEEVDIMVHKEILTAQKQINEKCDVFIYFAMQRI